MISSKKIKDVKNDKEPDEYVDKYASGVGMRIQELRLRDSVSQKKFADQYSISLPKISRIENGHRLPDTKMLLKLKEKYDCELDWLLTGEGKGQEETTESLKGKLLALLKKDQEFRDEVLSELGLRPPAEVPRNERIYRQLQEQWTDWQEIVELSERSESSASKKKTKKDIAFYKDGIAYLDVLLEVGHDPDE